MFNLRFSEFKVQTGLVWFSSAGKAQITEVWVEGGDGWRYCRFYIEEIWVSFFMPDQEDCLDLKLYS